MGFPFLEYHFRINPLTVFSNSNRVNDRIVSVNGISLENVEYATAVQVLRDSGNTVSLIVKRRAASSMSLSQPTTLKITLTKGKKEGIQRSLETRIQLNMFQFLNF